MNSFTSPYFAAIDLGSNSFHMLIARDNEGQLETVDKVKEMVQIASGLQGDGSLSEETQQRALDCLARFGERIKDIPKSQVRAVGTRTLRVACDNNTFMQHAILNLGKPIEIISGYEEARLVYQGVAHTLTDDHRQRLIIDIGGGSTEFIIGRDETPIKLESLGVGCVTFADRFGLRENPRAAALRLAYNSASARVEKIRRQYRQTGWDVAYGTSGTMRALADLLQTTSGTGGIITLPAINDLLDQLMRGDSLPNKGIAKLRYEVLPAGIAIVKAIMDELSIDQIHVADAALKEGLLYDIVGRLNDSDLRDNTVQKLQNQYYVDTDQAQRVTLLAISLWNQISDTLPDNYQLAGISRTKILKWASMLHEVGLSISHSGYHNHSFYILRHSDLAGFSRYEQFFLANLVQGQRKQVSRTRFDTMSDENWQALGPLILCLRIAILLHRRREDLPFYPRLTWAPDGYTLSFEDNWLEDHPLTRAGLEQEIAYFSDAGITLVCD